MRIQITPDIVKTVACDSQQTAGSLMATALNFYQQWSPEATDLKSLWNECVLKFRGYEEYVVNYERTMISYETVYNLLRNGKKIELLLININTLPSSIVHQVNELRETAQTKLNSRIVLPKHDQSRTANRNNTECPITSQSSIRFRIRMGSGITNIDLLHLESHGLKPQSKAVRMYTTVGLYYIKEILTLKTDEFMYHGGNLPSWSKIVEGPLLYDLPSDTLIHFIVWAQTGKKSIPLGWANLPLTDWRGTVWSGPISLTLNTDTPNPLRFYTSKRSPSDQSFISKATLRIEFLSSAEGMLYYPGDFECIILFSYYSSVIFNASQRTLSRLSC